MKKCNIKVFLEQTERAEGIWKLDDIPNLEWQVDWFVAEATTLAGLIYGPNIAAKGSIEKEHWPARCWSHKPILVTWHFTQKGQTSSCTLSCSKLNEIDAFYIDLKSWHDHSRWPMIKETHYWNTNNCPSPFYENNYIEHPEQFEYILENSCSPFGLAS